MTVTRVFSSSVPGLILIVVSILTMSCGAMPPPDTGGPRANSPVYPPTMKDDPLRRDATLNAVYQALAPQGSVSEVALQPVTATIQSLPADTVALYLPKIGADPSMTEEETRESLRRFIEEWRHIIGADPNQLSLVQRTDQPDGKRVAAYDQRPFRYPLRGNFGKLRITFNADRRVLDLTSTCIPDADRLQSQLASVNPVLNADDAVKYVRENALSQTDANGRQQLISIPPNSAIEAKELVFYVQPGEVDTLEFHLAWAVTVANAPFKILYVDAVKAEVLAFE